MEPKTPDVNEHKQELEEDSERDVASDAEENSNNIQYWKY